MAAAPPARPCPACGGAASLPGPRLPTLALVRCAACGLLYVPEAPTRDGLLAFYGEAYFRSADSREVGYTDYLADEGNIRATFRRRLRDLVRLAPPGRVLSVGEAHGFFLDEARRLGFVGTGIELSDTAARHAREGLGLDVRTGPLEDASLPPASFDWAVLYDVVEHFADPAAALVRVASALRPGGLCVLTTPDVEAPTARATGASWMGWKSPGEHLSYFSRRTLRGLLRRSGLRPIRERYVGKFVTGDLFVRRIRLYLPGLARAFASAGRLLGLPGRVYVNPYDIIEVVARRA
ncbi:MAG: class I SAM-dependent methyltransferase [Planctomycetales bacterium]|nr:class I SAM-dependent methyltransferase [Planctomycetales bacterium]